MQIFFNSVHTQYNMKHSWLNPWMWNLGSRGPTVKLYVEFLFHKILTPLSLAIVQDSTILSSPTAMIAASQVVLVVKNQPANAEMQVRPLGQEDPWRRAWQPTPVFLPGESH